MSVASTFAPAPAAGFAPQSLNYYSSPDPAGFLPPGAADRYQALALRVEDLRSLIPLFDARHEASQAKLEIAARLKRLTDHRSLGGFELSNEDVQVAPVIKELAARTAEVERLTKLDATRSAVWQSAGALFSNVRTWIRDSGSRRLEDIKVPAPKLLKSETALAAIDRLREESKGLRAKLAEIERAPVPAAIARARAKEQLIALASLGAVNVAPLLTPAGGLIGFPETQLSLKVYNADPAAVVMDQAPHVLALLAAVAGPALAKICDDAITAASDDRRALTDDQRAKQTAQASDALFAAELDEATLTLSAWESGLPVEANSSLQPAAWLAVRAVKLPPADLSAPSTAHAYNVIGPRR